MTNFRIGNFIKDYKGYVPTNSISEGERIIMSVLTFFGVKYESQAPIEISHSINKTGVAFLDFYLPALKMVIEYNGQQHYDPTNQKQQMRDEYVRQFCVEHNLKLIEYNSLTHVGNKHNLPWDLHLKHKITNIIQHELFTSRT